MERWYIALRTHGNPQELLNKLNEAVRGYDLGDFVVRFCYEKGAGKTKRGEFYVFLGVVSNELGEIPDQFYHNLGALVRDLRLRDDKAYVYFDDVQRMVSKELEIHNLRRIRRLNRTRPSYSDPFTYSARSSQSSASPKQNEAYTQLLYWLSMYGSGTWQQFKATCQTLGLDSTGDYSRRILRRLRSLGHIELRQDGQKWFVAPAALVATNLSVHGSYQTFLTGQRSNKLIQTLRQHAQLETELQAEVNAPESIKVHFQSEDEANNFAQLFSEQHFPLYCAGDAALRIANALPHLYDWQAELSKPEIVRSHYDYEQWHTNSFHKVVLPKETGLYRLTNTSNRNYPQLTLFYDANQQLWYKGDWYGLRYLMLRRTGQACEFRYDMTYNKLYIAHNNRLPEIYERALVLASGRLPVSYKEKLIFGAVSPRLAKLLATKLDAEFIENL